MTVEQLITALCQYPPECRVVVPGQEFGLCDVGDVVSAHLSFWETGYAEAGCWIPDSRRRAERCRERCVVLGARSSRRAMPGSARSVNRG
jgi:hypothetical protein